MSRSKSTEYVGFKCPPELREDMLFLAARRGWTESEIWKHAGERLCSFVRTIHLDYYDDIRPFHSFLGDQPDSTERVELEEAKEVRP